MVAPVQNWQEVRQDSQPAIPSCRYNLQLASVEPVMTKQTGLVALNLDWLVTEPAAQAGSKFTDMAVLGSKDDPRADKPETQRPGGPWGWGTCKRILGIFWQGEDKIPPNTQVVELLQQCVGLTLQAQFTVEVDGNPASQYYNRRQNRIQRYFPLNDQPAGTCELPDIVKGAQGGGLVQRPAGPPGAPPTPTTLPPRPTAPPAAVAAPPAPASPPQEALAPAPPASPQAPGGALPQSPAPRPPGA